MNTENQLEIKENIHKDKITCIRAGNSCIVSGDASGSVFIRDFNLNFGEKLGYHHSPITVVDQISDNLIVSGSSYGQIKIWNKNTKQFVCKYKPYKNLGIRALRVENNNIIFGGYTRDKLVSLQIYDIQSECIKDCSSNSFERIRDIIPYKNAYIVATNRSVILYDFREKDNTNIITNNNINIINYNPDNDLLYATNKIGGYYQFEMDTLSILAETHNIKKPKCEQISSSLNGNWLLLQGGIIQEQKPLSFSVYTTYHNPSPVTCFCTYEDQIYTGSINGSVYRTPTLFDSDTSDCEESITI
ncbi:hypothetical protein WA158_005888 [Blastocystis sp. Blastoise]